MRGPSMQALPIIMTTLLPPQIWLLAWSVWKPCAMARGFASGYSRLQSWQEPLPDGALLTPLLTPLAQRSQQFCYQL